MEDRDNESLEINANEGEDEIVWEVEATVTAVLQENFNKLEDEFRSVFDERMVSFASQHEDKRRREAEKRKKGVLHTNKVRLCLY